jgi:hypothetical protein
LQRYNNFFNIQIIPQEIYKKNTFFSLSVKNDTFNENNSTKIWNIQNKHLPLLSDAVGNKSWSERNKKKQNKIFALLFIIPG